MYYEDGEPMLLKLKRALYGLGFGKRHSRISYVMRLALSTVHLHSHGAQGGLHQGYISDHHSAHE